MKRLLAVLVVTAFLISACSEKPWQTLNISSVMPPLKFNLTDETGKTVTEKDYEGKVTLLFFGFTSCPGVCPTTMARLSRVIAEFPADERGRTQVLFVSVDPERDSIEALRDYTAQWGPQFVGLTGTQEQLRELSKRYRVTYSYEEPNEQGAYMVSHSGAVFALSPDGEAHLLIRDSNPIDAVVDDIRRLHDS